MIPVRPDPGIVLRSPAELPAQPGPAMAQVPNPMGETVKSALPRRFRCMANPFF